MSMSAVSLWKECDFNGRLDNIAIRIPRCARDLEHGIPLEIQTGPASAGAGPFQRNFPASLNVNAIG